MAYRFVRVGIVLVFVFLIAWAMTFQTLFTNMTGLGEAFVMQVRLAQFTQVLLYVATAIAAWNVFIVWSGKQSWFGKLWSIVLLLSVVLILLFSGFNGLLSWETNF